MKRFVSLTLLLVLLVTAVLPAFAANPAQEGKGLNFVMIVKTLDNPFYQTMKKAAEIEAKKQGVNLIFTAPARETDLEEQRRMVEDALVKKPDVISITPSGMVEIIPAILECNQAGVPVLNVDTPVDKKLLDEAKGKIEGFIGTDNLEGGRAGGEYAVKLLGGKGNVAILEGTSGNMNTALRAQGFREVVEKAPGMKIVASQPANTERALGMTVTENILEANPNLDAIFATNDLMALGALEAVKARGLEKQVKIIGYDAISESVQAVKDGTALVASIAQFPDKMGIEAVRSAIKIKKGEKLPDWLNTGVAVVDSTNYRAFIDGAAPLKQPGPDKPRIGFVVKTLTNPFYMKMKAAAEDAAKTYNVDLLFQASRTELDTEEFIRITEDMIQKKVDGLVLVPGAPDETTPVANKAIAAGIPVMATETDFPDVNTITFLGISNQDAAASIVQYIHQKYVVDDKKIPANAEVIILTGVPGYATSTNRAAGYHIGLQKYWPEAKVAAEQTANWDRTDGLNVTTNILQANPNVKVIFGSNDEMALGAYEATKSAGKDGIVITGFDAVMDALQAVKDGRLAATLDQGPDKYGYNSVIMMADYIRQGAGYRRFTQQETPLVTAANVDTFIEAAKKYNQ
jgi:ribose transport system substrate-binding protein